MPCDFWSARACGKVLVTARGAGGERRAKIRDLQKFTIDTGRAGSRMQGPPKIFTEPPHAPPMGNVQ